MQVDDYFPFRTRQDTPIKIMPWGAIFSPPPVDTELCIVMNKTTFTSNGSLLRSDEVAQRLNTSIQTIRRWARVGILSTVRFTRKSLRFPESEIERFCLQGIREEGAK